LRAVLGIGNPGRKYENTRHNVGFMLLDKLAEKYKLSFKPSTGDYYYAGSENIASPFFLIKPTTYVNLSGIAAKQFLEKFNVDTSDLLVVTDDLNLENGRIRLRQSGGDGGHNGIHSIIYHLESDKFPRLRFGIGNDFENGAMKSYVLEEYSNKELELLKNDFEFAISLVENFIAGGLNRMLNHFSQIAQQKKSNSELTNKEGK